MGRGVYLAAYSALSLALLAWLIAAARRAESPLLWDPAPWQWHVTLVLMPLATFLLVAGLLATNPLSISFRSGSDPGAITAVTRHPVLWAFLIWALAHIPPNGDLVSVILFGGMASFSVAGFFILDAKARRRLGTERWHAVAGKTSVLPLATLLAGHTPWRHLIQLIPPAVIATGFHVWFVLQGHALLIGPDPLASLAG
jgi:uncharacterized membrane protein